EGVTRSGMGWKDADTCCLPDQSVRMAGEGVGCEVCGTRSGGRLQGESLPFCVFSQLGSGCRARICALPGLDYERGGQLPAAAERVCDYGCDGTAGCAAGKQDF